MIELVLGFGWIAAILIAKDRYRIKHQLKDALWWKAYLSEERAHYQKLFRQFLGL